MLSISGSGGVHRYFGNKAVDCRGALSYISDFGFSCNADLVQVGIRCKMIIQIPHCSHYGSPAFNLRMCRTYQQLIEKPINLENICCDMCDATTTEKASCSGSCQARAFLKDGNCDDGNNNCGCGWDGGDCCGVNENKHQFGYRTRCECLDPSFLSPKNKGSCSGKCGKIYYTKDGHCDNNNNNCGCNWDNGDCCGMRNEWKQAAIHFLRGRL